jgi:serine protease inhibitor
LFKVFISRHKNECKNLCFSSAAVFNSLVMILIGSRNKSESQSGAVLHLYELNADRKKFEELMHLRDVIMKANDDIIVTSTHLCVTKVLL